MSSFLGGRLRFCFSMAPRTNQSWTGKRRESRNSSVEIVWTDPNAVVAPTTMEWFPWTGSLSEHRVLSEDEERIRRGVVAQSRIEQSQVLRAQQALTGAALAPRNEHTREQLQNWLPQNHRQEIPQEVMQFSPDSPLTLDPHTFAKCLRNAPSGSAPGPGGCSNQMLKTCQEDAELLQLRTETAEDLATAAIPQCIFHAFRQATMTALMNPDGGIPGIATNTSFRRLVSNSLARQFMKDVEDVCSPFQFALRP